MSQNVRALSHSEIPFAYAYKLLKDYVPSYVDLPVIANAMVVCDDDPLQNLTT